MKLGRYRSDRRSDRIPIVNGRVPPHDLDAEAAVLSALLLSRDALDTVLEILKPEHFYSDANGRIYEGALTLAVAGSVVDIVTVASYLRDRETLARVGGASYLAQLADCTPAVSHVAAHANTVYQKWRLRSLIGTCQRVAAEGYGDVGEMQAFIDGAEQAIYTIAHDPRRQASDPLGDILRDRFRALVAANERGDTFTGDATHYRKLDEMMTGMDPTDLIVVAARPGMGKTSFVSGLSVNVAAPRTTRAPAPSGKGYVDVPDAPGRGVLFFSLEMSKEQIAERMLCSEARVDQKRYRVQRLQTDDWRRLADAGAFLTPLPIWVDDTTGISVLEIRAKVRRKQAEYNREASPGVPERKVGLVVIDYLQLLRPPEHIENREQQIAHNSRALKALAKELKVPVVALSQLNRLVETRSTKDKRPQLSDLRESGQIEQDADTILFIYRDEYYNPDTTNAKGIAEIIMRKARKGSCGTVPMRFTGSCTRFDELAPGDFAEFQDTQ